MSSYLLGILIELLNPIMHAGSNIIDSYFSTKLFKRLSTVIFIGSVLNVIFLPLVFFRSLPHMLSLQLFGIVAIISMIEVAYQFPYYWAFRSADTSVVASLFALGKICVPILAYFLIGERLQLVQYAGFAVVIAAAVALTFEAKRWRPNAAFFCMLGVSVLLGLETVLYKFAFDHGASWSSVLSWQTLFVLIISGGAVSMISANRRDVADSFRQISSVGPLFVTAQFLTWLGEAAMTFALTIIPASVASGINTTQPLFALLYAGLFARKVPGLFKEGLKKEHVIKKLICFAFIIAGTVLIVVG